MKWKLDETGEVFEETVDLRNRLPHEMEDKKLYFYIIGPQLYVYVTEGHFLPVGARQEHPPGAPKDLPYTYHRQYEIIYPEQANNHR